MFKRPTLSESFNYDVKAKTDAVTPATGEQLIFKEMQLENNTGGDITVGVGFKLDNSRWKFGQWDDSETASYTDDTTDAQDAGASDAALTTTTNNDGFVVQSLDKFGCVILQVGTAEAGSPVYEYTYWNGSSWATLSTLSVSSAYTVAEHLILFSPPQDWAALASGDTPVDTDGLTAGYYAIRMRATTAPTTAPLATQIWVAKLFDHLKVLSTNTEYNSYVEDDNGILLNGGESIIPIFSSSNADNHVKVLYSRVFT